MSTTGNSNQTAPCDFASLKDGCTYYIADPSVSGAWLWFTIAAAVTVLSLALYEAIRRRPGLKRVLYTRTETNRRESPPVPEELFGWIKPVWNLPESYIAENVGLDAVMFLRFLKMCASLFAILTLFLIPILIPVNYYASNDHGQSFADAAERGNSTGGIKFLRESLKSYSFSNIPPGSSFLWAHIVCAYAVSGLTYFCLFTSYRDYAHLATEYLQGRVVSSTSRRTPAWRKGEAVQLRTVLVQNMPTDLQNDAKLKAYFEALEIGSVEKVTVDRDPGNQVLRMTKQRRKTLKMLERAYIEWLVNIDREITKRKGHGVRQWYTPGNLLRLQASPLNLQDMGIDEACLARLRPKRRARKRQKVLPASKFATLSLSLGKDEIDHYTQKLTDLTVKLKYLRKVGVAAAPVSRLTPAQPLHREQVPTAPNAAAFVTFTQQRSAQLAAQVMIHASDQYLPMKITLAPAVQDVLWENISLPAWRRVAQRWIITIVSLLLTFFWAVPTTAIAFATSIEKLQKASAFSGIITKLAEVPRLYLLVKSVGPPIIINIINIFVPLIFEFLSKQQAYPSNSAVELATMSKYFFFLLFNVFFIFIVAQTLLPLFGEFLKNPISVIQLIFQLAVQYLPGAATFFINYIILNLMLFPVELLRPGIMIVQLVGRWLCKTPREFNELSIFSSDLSYGFLYPIHVLIFIIVLCYSTIAPFILLPGTCYFAVGWLVYRNQLLFVYVKEWENYGEHWVMAFRRCTIGLGIYQVLLASLLAAQESPTTSALCAPLVCSTIAFNVYCHRVFGKRSKLIPLDRFVEQKPVEPGQRGESDYSVEYPSGNLSPSSVELSPSTPNISTTADSSIESLEEGAPPSSTAPEWPALDIVTSADQFLAEKYPKEYMNPIFSKPLARPWLPVSLAAWWAMPRPVAPRREASGASSVGNSGVQRSNGIELANTRINIKMERTRSAGSGGGVLNNPTDDVEAQQQAAGDVDRELRNEDEEEEEQEEDHPVAAYNGTFMDVEKVAAVSSPRITPAASGFSLGEMMPSASVDSMTDLVKK
ncbi:hypothetical protein HDU86_006242 [Geranomyces michiganensis]|nr:hypothetical protein HDU86_006242 [Geranomyces michiganensis]